MKKVFLYLYPIKEYSTTQTFPDEFYKLKGLEKPFNVLNECIEKRYRNKGYEVILLTYPDKEIYGINLKPADKIIYTDVTFKEFNGCDKKGPEGLIEELKYPKEEDILKKIGKFDQVVVGGYHLSDCVKRLAEYFYSKGIQTLVDLELTELFFHVYKEKYFNKGEYNFLNFKNYFLSHYPDNMKIFAEKQFNEKYNKPIYYYNIDNVVNELNHKVIK